MKKNLVVSFSGGETSAYMAQWLWRNKQDHYNMVFVFANTSQENKETIDFVQKCSEHFGFKVFLIEAEVFHNNRKGNYFNIKEYHNLKMDGEVFEQVIKKHGIPNQSTPHCTRELKQVPIKKFADWYFKGEEYYLAIGIRVDEMDRQNKNKESLKIIYPLIKDIPMTKQMINFWWGQQEFRLKLKGYQGNCVFCWKKSDIKLYQIAKENPRAFDFPAKMELRYSEYIPESRLKLMNDREELPQQHYPITFFRGKRSAIDIINESKKFKGTVKDDAQVSQQLTIDLHNESCEVFADCGIDN